MTFTTITLADCIECFPLPKTFFDKSMIHAATYAEEDVARAWDKIAEEWFKGYDEFGDANRKYVIDPSIFNILSRIDGKRILNAGCGNGYLCRLLAEQGSEVVGVDISLKAIEMARTFVTNCQKLQSLL